MGEAAHEKWNYFATIKIYLKVKGKTISRFMASSLIPD
jgi:hypothetical protein